MPELSWQRLTPARQRASLSMAALHLRYVALGGMASLTELSAHLAAGGPLSPMEHNVAVHAINERFLELEQPERLSYAARNTAT